MTDYNISDFVQVGLSDQQVVNNALLAASAAGGGRVHGFNPQAPILVDPNIPTGGIRLQPNTHLDLGMAGKLKQATVGYGVGAIVRAGIGAQPNQTGRTYVNMKLTGGIIEGDRYDHVPDDPNDPGEQLMGVWSCNNDGFHMEGVEVKFMWGDAVFFHANDVSYQSLGGNDYTPRFNTVTRNRFHHCRRNGISGISAEGTIITENHIWGIDGTGPFAGIDLEPDSTGSDMLSTIIAFNFIRKCLGPGLEVANTSPGIVDRLIAIGNIVDECGGTNGFGFKIAGIKGLQWLLAMNSVSRCKSDGILVQGYETQPVQGGAIVGNSSSHNIKATPASMGQNEGGAGLRIQGPIDAIASLANSWMANGKGGFSWDGDVIDPADQHIKFGTNVDKDNGPDNR